MPTLTRKAFDRKSMPEYPFDIGYRWVRNGRATVQVPLTEDDFLHPQEEDRFLLTDAHSIAVAYLRHALETNLAAKSGFRVFSDHRIDFQSDGIEPMGPDIIAFDNFLIDWDPMVGTLPVIESGLKPLFVAEVTSISTRRSDLERKPPLYRQFGVPYYLIFDHFGGETEEFESDLIGYRLTAKGYVRMKADPEFGVWVPTVGMWFNFEGDRVVAYNAKKERIPNSLEMAQLLDEETARAEAETLRADAEKQRADALERELAELRAKLANPPSKKNGHK